MSSENKLQEVVQTTLAQIRNMIDADTVIGTPIVTAPGTTIIPVSKVCVGFATGGIDYNDKNGGAQGKPQNFGAGGGTGISVQPIGLICITKEGRTEFINIGVKTPKDPIDQLIELLDRSPEIVGKFKDIFDKKDDEIVQAQD